MSKLKNVIVVGATGNLGPTILQALLVSQKFNLSVLTREATSSTTFPEGVKIYKTDYSSSSLEEAFQGQDAIVSVIAGAGLHEQKKLVDAAIKSGVKRFIPSEYGGNTDSRDAQELVPVFSRKVEIKEYLAAKALDGSISWTGIISGPIFDRSLKLGLIGFDLLSKRATIYDSGERRFTASTLLLLGKAVIAVLSNPSATANKYVYVGSFTTTQNEILAALKAATGDQWTVEKTTSAEKVELGKNALLHRRNSSTIRPLVTAAMYHERGGSDFESDVGLSNDELGLNKENIESVVSDVVKDVAGV